MGPNTITYKKEKKKDPQKLKREHHGKMKTEIGICVYNIKNANHSGNQQKLEEAWKNSFLEPTYKAWLCQHYDLDF